MRTLLTWLAESGLPDGVLPADPATVGDAFVRVGLEVEEVEVLAGVTGPVVIAQVLAITELTGFNKPIRLCQLEVGEATPRGIVCGAQNFSVGDLVVAALPGSELPHGFSIAARKTYGEISDGMMCSARELGLGAEHSGILVLPPGTAIPGAAAAAVLGLDDAVLELAITPDRGYCFSMRGLAREMAAALGVAFTDPAAVAVPDTEGVAWPVTVDPASGCRRFTARRVVGVNAAAPSPWWLQRRLLLSGIRSISAAVDVTNYVMLEFGQPLHAFDAARLRGALQVRRAAPGETLRTLDDVVRPLDPQDVVIADSSGVLSLAGVMGGASTEVSSATTEVLLEAAIWDPVAVFRSARRHKLPSEASRRFERNVDPALAEIALERAATLLAEIAGGTLAPGRTVYGAVEVRPQIVIDPDLPDRVAGTRYPAGTTRRRLEEVGATVVEAGTRLAVTPPSWRPDLVQPADLVEEVLRLEGLDVIPSVLPAAPGGRGLTSIQQRRRAVSRALAATGYVEVLPTVFLPPGVFDAFGLDAHDPRRNTARVLNPLDADRGELATTLLPALLEALVRNVARGARNVSLFGLAQVVLPRPAAEAPAAPVAALPVDRRPTVEQLAAIEASLPRQPVCVATVLAGQRELAGWWGPGRVAAAGDAIAAAHAVADAAGVVLQIRAAQYAPWHPGRCAELLVNGVVVGHAGELHPGVVERLGLPARTCAMELELDAVALAELRPSPVVSPFPPVLQDVAVVVDEGVPAEDVRAALLAGAGALIEEVRLFDVYAGAQVAQGKRSLAFSLRFRAADRTLTEDEATRARDAAVALATERVGAVLRG